MRKEGVSQRSAPYSDFHIQGNCATRRRLPEGAEITHQLIACEVSDNGKFKEGGQSAEQAPCGRAKGVRGQVPDTLLSLAPHPGIG